jgi:cholera toxin transcriptional activator
MLVVGVVLALSIHHVRIVRRAQTECDGLVLHYASLVVVFRPMPAFQGNRSGRIVRFGVFELDLAAGELRKNGARVRLQEQPFQVLALLLECGGDVVTREEMRQKLWPADTFVDFDHSLNTAVNKLRETLGDSASSPRYIETLGATRISIYCAVAKAEVRQSTSGVEAALGFRGANLTAARLHPELEVPNPAARTDARIVCSGSGDVSDLLRGRTFSYTCTVEGIAESFLSGWLATALLPAVMVTAGVGIPLRCYLLSAVGFDYQRLGEKFQQMFPFILALDQLWAVAPFLLMQKIGLGAAFAASAALLYVPFSERSLIRMAYVRTRERE